MVLHFILDITEIKNYYYDNMRKKTKEDFILEANSIHDNQYDYTNVFYKNNSTKVSILCDKHGEFLKTPSKHISSKQGCPKCTLEKQSKKQSLGKSVFIDRSIKQHGDIYDYSLVDYKSQTKKVKIICPKHGVFEQIPSNHMSGKACKYCGGTTKYDTSMFISKSKEVHGELYDYTKSEYVNNATKITIICHKHGEFSKTPNNHISKKQGCPRCLDWVRDTKSFIEKSNVVHSNRYIYQKTQYSRINEKVTITCHKHGDFKQTPVSHLSGNNGCIECSPINKSEEEITTFLKDNKIDYIRRDRNILEGKELDIYMPSHNISIEYNGLYWHNEDKVPNDYHINKTNKCEDKGIQLIHIFEDEWIDNKEIVLSRLRNILGITSNKVYARKTTIRELTTSIAKSFCEENHTQGYVGSSTKLGLYHGNDLVSVMTFGKLRKSLGSSNIDGSYELLRFSNSKNISVIGGASKLLKYFIKNHHPKLIISYADRRWSMGKLYEKLGFKYVHNTAPNYQYIINKQRHHRYKFRKDVLVKEGFDVNKTEREIMQDRGIPRIYDCGHKKYSMTIPQPL